MSDIKTEQYQRKTFEVDAVQVTEENLEAVAKWCQGDVRTERVRKGETEKRYVKVRVHVPLNPRQTKAFVGDWVLYAGAGYKVYTDNAFQNSFERADAILHRSAESGRFVSEEFAEQNAATTVSEK